MMQQALAPVHDTDMGCHAPNRFRQPLSSHRLDQSLLSDWCTCTKDENTMASGDPRLEALKEHLRRCVPLLIASSTAPQKQACECVSNSSCCCYGAAALQPPPHRFCQTCQSAANTPPSVHQLTNVGKLQLAPPWLPLTTATAL